MPSWKKSTPVRQLKASDQTLYPSFFDSFLLWRQQLTAENSKFFSLLQPYMDGKAYYEWRQHDVIEAFYKIAKKENATGQCPQCDDALRITIEPKEGQPFEAWCLCQLSDWARKKYYYNWTYSSRFHEALLKQYNVKDVGGVNASMVDTVKACSQFIRDPSNWLILTGPKGTGKTMLARAIATHLGPGLCMYLRVSDFVAKLMSETSNRADGDVEGYMNAIMQAPVLILDDLGQAHMKEYASNMLLSVIDYRYQDTAEYPTVITTNESLESFQSDEWGVMGDRIADQRNMVVAIKADSYRQSPMREDEAKKEALNHAHKTQ